MNQLEQWDKKFLWHPFTQQSVWNKQKPLIIQSGQGVYLKDIHGRRYLDAVSSLWVNLQGHNNPAMNLAIKKQLGRIAHSTFLGLSHPGAILLAKKLAEITPPGLRRTFFSDNGATSVEIALKMAFQYWLEKTNHVRPEFLALQGSYHGDTIGAVSVGGIGSFFSKFKPLLFKTNFAMSPQCFSCPFNKTKARHRFRTGEKITNTPKPGDARPETGCRWECLGEVETILKKRSRKIAAAIVEPLVQGAAGMVVMPPGYMAGFQRLCRKYKVLLIADEVATGFGRTGTMFACEQENIKPDFLCLAKALTGGYSPLAATMTTESVFKAFWGPVEKKRTFFHGHSYTAHPLGCAAALANLDLIKSRKLLEKSRQTATLMKEELRSLKILPNVESIRQAGLMAAVELNKGGALVCKALLSYGIWARPLGDVIVLMPPLVISAGQLTHLIGSLKKVLLHETKT